MYLESPVIIQRRTVPVGSGGLLRKVAMLLLAGNRSKMDQTFVAWLSRESRVGK
jgi:hypothetical protein